MSNASHCNIVPRVGTRVRRILDALYTSVTPIPEAQLMAMHRLDGLSPTIWRSGPYKSLSSNGLIDSDGTAWALTELGRRAMGQLQRAAARDAVGTDEMQVVPSRTAPAFKPLRVPPRFQTRDGADDYRRIPSLHGDKRSPYV